MTPEPRDERPTNPLEDEIDKNLQRIFDETAQQPLPPKLAELVEKLRSKEQRK